MGTHLTSFNDLCRITTNDAICRHILGHHSVCRYNSTISDGNTTKYRCLVTNPYIIAYYHRTLSV